MTVFFFISIVAHLTSSDAAISVVNEEERSGEGRRERKSKENGAPLRGKEVIVGNGSRSRTKLGERQN